MGGIGPDVYAQGRDPAAHALRADAQTVDLLQQLRFQSGVVGIRIRLVKFYGYEPELGYFNINEFEKMNARPWHLVNGEMRLCMVERDLHWTPCTVGECREY